MEDNKYYCPHCDWFFKPSDVDEQDDGITDTTCPVCNRPLQQEGSIEYGSDEWFKLQEMKDNIGESDNG